jgi:hypothetical protein
MDLVQNPKKYWKYQLTNDQVDSISSEVLKVIDSHQRIPFWTEHSKHVSDSIPLPLNFDSSSTILETTLKNSQTKMGSSWFSIEEKHIEPKPFDLSKFEIYDLEENRVSYEPPKIPKPKPKKKGRTQHSQQSKNLKIRAFPTLKEKEELTLLFEQFRWLFNSIKHILLNHYGVEGLKQLKSLEGYQIWEVVKNYQYVEKAEGDVIVKDFVFDSKWDRGPIPPWWNKYKYQRIPRGVRALYASSLNSVLTHFHRYGREISLPVLSKKNTDQIISFDDGEFPALFKNMRSVYTYRQKTRTPRRRATLSLSEIIKLTRKRAITFIYQQDTDKYYIHYPVDASWFPPLDIHGEKQTREFEGKTVIALDPGVRKFMVGYDPTGHSIYIGDGAHHYTINRLLEIDQVCIDLKKAQTQKEIKRLRRRKINLWREVKHRIDELHWKTIRYLVDRYDIIILPEFRVSQMLRQKKLNRKTKRVMSMYSYYKFKERLAYKCKVERRKLVIVGEEYTSRTCTCCGQDKKVGGAEIYHCKNCGLKIDRDVNGSRNIFIKNTRLCLPPK